ncbi:MAG: 30S ribosomal protein S21 [Anaerolineae bacterium]
MITLPKVELRSNESPEHLLRRFNKEVAKSKVLSDLRRKRWFVSKSELERIERKKAIRRQSRLRSKTRRQSRLRSKKRGK